MPMDQWPCQPSSLEDFMDEDTIRFVLAGAAEKYRAPLTIVDTKKRYDPFVPRQQATQFCLHLRGNNTKEIPGIRGADKACREWDDLVAKKALDPEAPAPELGEPVHKPCWLKLSDYIVNLSVGEHRFVLLTGQRLPADPDLRKADIELIRERVLEEATLPPENRKLHATEHELKELPPLIPEQPIADDKYLDDIRDCAKNIYLEFSKHWTLLRDALEDNIYQELITKAQNIRLSQNGSVDWYAVKGLILEMCSLLGCEIAVLFSHETFRGSGPNHLQNLLRLRASPGHTDHFGNNPPHFNWNKSRLSKDKRLQILFGQKAKEVVSRGVRSDREQNVNITNVEVVFALSDAQTGCRTVLMLGGFKNLKMVEKRSGFLKMMLTTLSQSIHNLQLFAGVHHTVLLNKELAEFLAHQVRSQMQTLKGFQTIALRFSREEAGMDELKKASSRFQGAFEDLFYLSKFVYEDTPTFYDSDKMQFERVSSLVLIEAAIESQAAYAEKKGIVFRIKNSKLAPVKVDPFWYRIMLGHLINNAIKYSRGKRPDNERWISIHAERSGNFVWAYIENFGLGILKEDLERIFEARVDARRGLFQYRTGSGRGLFEARRIAYAHGGTITVISKHHTGGEVRKEDIEECLTTVGVSVPVA